MQLFAFKIVPIYNGFGETLNLTQLQLNPSSIP